MPDPTVADASSPAEGPGVGDPRTATDLARRRWARINLLFAEAVELPEAERAAFLDGACDCRRVRAEVDSLLAADLSALAPFDDAGMALLDHSAGTSSPGVERIGPYLLGAEIGRGGMGAVYLGVRDDDLDQQVAIKMLAPGRHDPDQVRRFQQERQILARLDHPHIAKLFDSGTTEDGRPYFVMEHVAGLPIDRYCDHHRLSLRRRLELFRKICAAVQAAHRSLVVHRDLKPSNILVDSAGQPKLLDFGIAKLLDPDPEHAATLTRVGCRPMTPGYASPEHVRGEPITTASDVYSLGVLLYELLTGQRPYRIGSQADGEIRRIVCEQQPPRPSTVVDRSYETRRPDGATDSVTAEALGELRSDTPRRLRRQLAGDLDTIVLEALRKDPERRYPSAHHLDQDLGRYLDGLPIGARPDTWAYRTRKLVRRRPWEAGLVAVLLAVIGFASFGHWQQSRLVAQQRDRAETVAELMVSIFEVADPHTARGQTISAREILERGVEQIRARSQDDPALRAPLLSTLARVYRNLGLYDRAAPLAEEALELFHELDERQRGSSPDVAPAIALLGRTRLSQGRYPEAENLLRSARERTRELLGEDHPDAARLSTDLGITLEKQQRWDEAEPVLRRALEQQRRLYPAGHLDLATTLGALAVTLQNSGDLEAAEAPMREQVEMLRHRVGDAPHPTLAQGLNDLALLLYEKGDLDSAEALYQESLEILRQLYGERHPDIARTISNLAFVVRDRGRVEDAVDLLGDSYAMRAELLGPDHPDLAGAAMRHARGLLYLERPAEALPRAEVALRIFGQILPPDHSHLVYLAGIYGACLSGVGRHAEAEGHLLRSYRGIRELRGEKAHDTRVALGRLVELYESWQKPEEVLRYRQLALSAVGDEAP